MQPQSEEGEPPATGFTFTAPAPNGRRPSERPAVSSLVQLLRRPTNALLRALGIASPKAAVAPEEQIQDLMKAGAESGVFKPAEHELVRRVFRFSDQRASTLMTPMQEIVWLDVTDSPEQMQRKIRESPHGRFPVCEGSIDIILGVVQVKELLIQSFSGKPFGIKGLLMIPLFIYEGTLGLKVLEMFKQTGNHIAIVLNEYGSVVGLLTLNDLLSAIVGELSTGDDSVSPKTVQRPDGSWLLNGMLNPDAFHDIFGQPLPPGDYRTLAGFVVSRLGHIPRVSERFDWNGLSFEVAAMDAHRVDQVVVAPSRGS